MLCVLLEPIQSRCAVLRYSKLTEAQILSRMQEVCDKEAVSGNYYVLLMCVVEYHRSLAQMMAWKPLFSLLKVTCDR